uniref:Uncharacterized protein n=1 Tax=Myotis myotis TaxID=51298 RepID=A0A7J7VII8_MYOMY|nr:hypothetical protein mMyoMyo1_008242 [Myotis myotis]
MERTTLAPGIRDTQAPTWRGPPWPQASGTHIDCVQLQAIFQLLCCFPSSLSTHHHCLRKDKCTAPLLLGVFPGERHSLLQHILMECLPQARHCEQLREQHSRVSCHDRPGETVNRKPGVGAAGTLRGNPVPRGAPAPLS